MGHLIPPDRDELICATLQQVDQHYLHGHYLSALETLRKLDEATLWSHPAAAIAAGQVAGMTGSSRLRIILYRRAWQLAPHSSQALYYHARGTLLRRSSFAARELIARHENTLDLGTPEWLSLRAYLQADQRDFLTADRLMAEALAAREDDPWLHVEHAYQLELADRYDEALAATARSLQIRPWYRPAVQHRAKLLQLRGEDETAYHYLREAVLHLESEGVLAQLFNMQLEAGDYTEAHATLERIETLTPLKDRHYHRWFAGAQCDVAYALGDIAGAARRAREANNPFRQRLAGVLEEQGGNAPHKLLNVEFVRQRHNTCGPATMSALTRYFEAGHEQDALVAAIWYNGTNAYQERRWGLENGWHVREFTADWKSSVALIEREIPFALSTQEADSAHLQAVIGYDANRDYILIRDPFLRHNQEFAAGPFFERYRSTGPRGMLFIPQDKAALLNDIELPDADAYDHLYAIDAALANHDRPLAEQLGAQLEALAPNSRIALLGTRALARYDRNDMAALAAIRATLQLYPEDTSLHIGELDTLQRMGDTATYVDTLRNRARHASAAPQLQLRYARWLINDARRHGEARQRLKHLLRRNPYQADGYAALADLEWAAGNRRQASQHYRTAAGLQIDSEQYALDYFRAARFLRQTDEALAWLRERSARYENHSAQPVISLFQALALLNREHEGLTLLETAQLRRPSDGDLLLFTADALRNNGRFAAADQQLRHAEGMVPRARWLSSLATLLTSRSQRHEALAHWREVADIEPLNIAAHRAIAELLSSLEGRDAAVRYTDQLLDRYPHIQPVLELRIDWLDRQNPGEALGVVERFLALTSGNAWAWREKAIILNQQGNQPAALSALAMAEQLQPFSVPCHHIKGDILLRMGDINGACEAYRHAITLSVDAGYAIDRLLQHSYTTAQKRDALNFVREELTRQVVDGDGLLSYQNWASGVIATEELLSELRTAWQLRPDLWHSGSALIQQLIYMGQVLEALTIAESAVERFPLLPRVWLDLARCRRLMGDESGEAAALQQALEINPDWIQPTLRLSEYHERRGDYEQSRQLLANYLQKNDADSRIHGYLAATLWHLDQHSEALLHIQRAVELAPSYVWAWERLGEWAASTNQQSLPIAVARRVVEKTPGDVDGWLALAGRLGPCEESLQLLHHAIALEPRRVESHDILMQHLTHLDRFDEARGIAANPVWEGNIPVALRTNLPWVRYRQGRIREAITEMRHYLDTEPRHAEAWRMLSVWAENANERDIWLDASRHYAQLLPNDAVAQSYLAGALVAHQQNDEAITCYRKAVQLAPDDENSALNLFDLQFAAGDSEEAAQTLKQLALHHPHGDSWIAARQIQLHCRNGEQQAATSTLQQLLDQTRSGQWPLETAVTAMDEAGWSGQVDRELAAAIHPDSRAHVAVGRVWINRLQKQNRLREARRRVAALFACGPAGVEAVDALLDIMTNDDAPLKVRFFIWRNRQALKHFTTTWASVGYFYAKQALYRETIAWMSDWRSREEVPSWALNNLIVALQEFRRWGEAEELSARALKNDPGKFSHSFHLWLALEAGLRGELSVMEQEMDAIDIEELSANRQYAYHLMLALHRSESLRSNSTAALQEIRSHLRNGLKVLPGYASDTTLRHLRRRVMGRITAAMGRFPFNLYYHWRLL